MKNNLEVNCLTCKYSSWNKTKTGKLHPTGDGHCDYEFKIVIPKAYYFVGGGKVQPCGGYINRKSPCEYCPTWARPDATIDR